MASALDREDVAIEAKDEQAPFQVRGAQAAPSEQRHEMLPGIANCRERRTQSHRDAFQVDACTIVVIVAIGMLLGNRWTSGCHCLPSRRGPIGEGGHGSHGRHGTISTFDARGGRIASDF